MQLQVQSSCRAGAEVQRCRGAEMQHHVGADAGADEVQWSSGAGAEVQVQVQRCREMHTEGAVVQWFREVQGYRGGAGGGGAKVQRSCRAGGTEVQGGADEEVGGAKQVQMDSGTEVQQRHRGAGGVQRCRRCSGLVQVQVFSRWCSCAVCSGLVLLQRCRCRGGAVVQVQSCR